MRLLAITALCCTLSAHDPWTKQDTILEGIFLAQLAVDRTQTLDIKNHPGHYETNPILGMHPSDRRINNHFLFCAIVHPAISYVLPRKARTVFQIVYISMEANAISGNISIGLRCKF